MKNPAPTRPLSTRELKMRLEKVQEVGALQRLELIRLGINPATVEQLLRNIPPATEPSDIDKLVLARILSTPEH